MEAMVGRAPCDWCRSSVDFVLPGCSVQKETLLMPTLEVLDGPNKGEVFQVDRDEMVVGRLPYCDIVLAQKNVSRQHTRIVRSGGAYAVEDMNSTNGTFLNGKRVRQRTPLKDQDLIRIYNVSMLFREMAVQGATDVRPGKPETVEMGAPGTKTETNAASPERQTRVAGAIQARNVGVNVYEKLKTVLDINRALGSTLDINQVLPKILDGLFTVFPQSDRAYVLFPDSETGQLEVKAEKQKEEGTLASSSLGPISHTVANRVMSQADAILSADGIDDDEFDISESVLDFPIRSMMCAPLLGPMQKPLGIIYVDTNDPYEHFHEDDLEVLISVAATAGQALEYATAHEAQLRLDRRNRELATAKEVQLHFLPQARPDVPGYCFYDYYSSAEEVGGDYYGYLSLPDGRVAMTLGDVSGKGISAALVMARLCSEVRYRLVTEGDPCQAVQALNREFSKPENDPWFVTFVLCILDPREHQVTIVNAGHRPPMLRKIQGQVQEVGQGETGMPLGCQESAEYAPFTMSLEPGDALFVYTDGINEAMSPDKKLYGVDRVREAIGTGPERIDGLGDFLLSDLRQFTHEHSQSDDICVIGLQRE